MKPIKHLLALIDDQTVAEEILKKSIELAQQFNAHLLIVHTLHIPFLKLPEYNPEVPVDKEKIKATINTKVEMLRGEESLNYYTMVYFGDSTERAIIEATRDDIDLIITGSTIHINKLVNKVQKPILIINSEANPYHNLLVPTDLSSKSKESIGFVQTHFPNTLMRSVYGYERIAMVTSMYDISYADMVEYQEENREIAETLFKNFEQETGVEGELIDATFSLGHRLVEYIDEKEPDLVVVASGSTSDIFNFGSISSYIAKESAKDILIYC